MTGASRPSATDALDLGDGFRHRRFEFDGAGGLLRRQARCVLERRGRSRDASGTDRQRRAFELVGDVRPPLRRSGGAGQGGSKVTDLRREQAKKLVFESLVALALAAEIVSVDRRIWVDAGSSLLIHRMIYGTGVSPICTHDCGSPRSAGLAEGHSGPGDLATD
jgi:hypothetical protein